MFDFNSIPPCLQQWLPIITKTPKIQCRIVIPQVLDENKSLLLNLSQRGLQIVINNKGINILIFQMTLDKV